MSMMLTFTLPILIILLVVAVWAFSFFMKKYFSVKATHWMMLIYTSLLILSAIVVLFGTKAAENAGEDIILEKDSIKLQREIHDALSQEKKPVIDNELMTAERTFELDTSVLKIDSDWEYSTPFIVVERSAEADQTVKMQVYSYISQTVDGSQFLTTSNPPEMKISGDQLLFSKPAEQELKLSIVTDEFTVSQFKKGERPGKSYSGATHYYIFMQVPEDLQIDEGDGVEITYVNEVASGDN